MKIFNYDEKHEVVNGELDLGTLLERDINLLQKVVNFCEDYYITNRYSKLVIAESYEIQYDDGEPFVVFH